MSEISTDQPEPEYFGTRALSQRTGLSVRSIERYREKGLLPYRRLNARRFLYRLPEVVAAIDAFTVKPAYRPKS